MLPNFLIAGATRSGTTSLYYYLKQHPEISFPKLKEPRYFSSINLKLPQKGPGDETVDEKLILNYDDYCDLYRNINNKRVGDASSEYLYHHDSSAREILQKLGDIPVIIILRNPIERAYSAYNNLVRDGREYLSFEDAVEKEENRLIENWDMMWAYTEVSMYYEQVKTFKNTFTNVKILIFEDFVENTQDCLKEIFNFLKINENFIPVIDTVYSNSGVPSNKFLGWITSRKNKFFYPLRKLVINNIPRKYLERFSKYFLKKTHPDIKLKKQTIKKLETDILKLEKLLDRNFDSWKINKI